MLPVEIELNRLHFGVSINIIKVRMKTQRFSNFFMVFQVILLGTYLETWNELHFFLFTDIDRFYRH